MLGGKRLINSKLVEAEQVLTKEADWRIVDVRTKSEFDRGTIPGSVNAPLFDEIEQRRIGRAYAISQPAAKFLAMDIVAPRIAKFVRGLNRLAQAKPLLVFCWRGGLRSHTALNLLSLAGVPAAQLKGGYHQYRRRVHHMLQTYALEQEIILLAGPSGVGKTDILGLLARQGYPVIDLEALAGHRGSLFGDLAGAGPQSQKNFEARLLGRLLELRASPYLLLEGESRRIGNICLPDFLYTGMKSAAVIELTGSMPARTERIYSSYRPQTERDRLAVYEALSRLGQRLGPRLTAVLSDHLDRGQYRPFAQQILAGYYDQRYAVPSGRRPIARIDTDDIAGAVQAIKDCLAAGR